jgi:hypothetical protein
MQFYKGCESLSFFISTYVVFFLQILFVYFVDDINSEEMNETNTTLIMHKQIFSVIFIFTVYTHYVVSFHDPGIIEKDNNLEVLEFYNFIYKEINQIKNKFNRTREREDESDDFSEESSLSLSSEEDNNLPITNKNIISKRKQKIISEKYDFEVSKCKSCYVLRPSFTHHCSECHNCILDRENHCPWMNNCIGLFNRKNYILFCLYSVISVSYSFLIYFYYKVLKNFSHYRDSLLHSLLGIFWLFYCFVYGGFCLMLLTDERKAVIKEFRHYGKEKNKLMRAKMQIIFGGNFSIKWFLPCFEGGKKSVFSFLKKKNEGDNLKNKKYKKAVIKKS